MVSKYNFIKFEDPSKAPESRFSITRSGTIGFPAQFFHLEPVNYYPYVVLYFDQEKRAIGIRFTDDEVEKSKFNVIRSGGGGAQVYAKKFFNLNEINTATFAGKYKWEKEELPHGDSMYVIGLKTVFDEIPF